MKISILTCDRKPSYLEGTLASLRATAPDVEPTIVQDDWSRALPPTQRLTLSFRRALLESDGDVLICEDDVEFRADWRTRLSAAVAHCDALKGPRSDPADPTKRRARHYFLACYSPHLLVGEPVAPYRAQIFFGTQACFIPDGLRVELAGHLEREQAVAPHDALIAQWSSASDVRLFATGPSLVQHVGKVSALGDPFHSSPMFARAS